MTLRGKVAIVTGAAYGIGFATAERFAREGATVVVTDIRGHEAAAARLQGLAGTVAALTCDVTSDESVESLVGETLARFGSADILVNNAAISAEIEPGPFEAISVDDWRRVLEVNVLGVFRMCRAVSRPMRRSKWGRIVNLTSGTAFKGVPGMLHYVASKGAIISMTRSLASEFGADNVLVNAVSPGLTMTESVRASPRLMAAYASQGAASRALKRDAVAEDVAAAIYFLASADSGFVTGQVLAADGGSVFH